MAKKPNETASPLARFYRIGSFLVNLDHVRAIKPQGSNNSVVEWSNGDDLDVPRYWIEDLLSKEER